MEWWRLLLAYGCPDAGKPLPHCLRDWTGEHDMAEAGELAHASMVRAGMRLWSTSADVSEEGFFFFFFWRRFQQRACPEFQP